jgi:hypothetical protein
MTRVFRTVALGVFAAALCVLIVLHSPTAVADEKKASPLDGAWQLVESKNGEAQEYQKPPQDTVMTIYVTAGRFVWTVVKDGKIGAAAGGKYAVDKDKWTESIEYIHGDGVPESFVGSSFDFTWKVEGNTWHKVGVVKVNGQDIKIDEKWERCK